MGTRDRLVSIARSYEGVPYKGIYQGTGPEDGGFTCSGFSWRVYNDAGIDIPICQGIHSYYTGSYNGWDTQAGWCLSDGHWTDDPDDLLPGDLVFYSPVGDPERTGHVAVYSGNGNIVHACGKPVCEEDLYAGGRFVGGGWPLKKTPEQEEAEMAAKLQESEMNVMITIVGKNTVLWLCNDEIHDLTHPDDIVALDRAWGACHNGAQMPRMQMEPDWYARLVQCCNGGLPKHLAEYNDKFKPRS